MVTGVRIVVELILSCFTSDWTMEDILESYPHITREDVIAALAYARHLASARQLIEISCQERTHIPTDT